jgi:membrane fusion protein, multidrug efflux system
MKAGKWLIILFILIIAVIIYVNKISKLEKKESSAASKAKIISMKVSGIIVSQREIEDKIYSSGTVLANEEVEVRNEIAGKIIKLNFKEGSHVRKGDLLVKLFDEDLRAQLRKLQLQKELAQKSESRQKDLLTANGISQQEYELAQNELFSVEADIDLLKSQLKKTEITAPFDGTIGLKTVSEGAFLAANTRIATIQDIDPLKLEFSIPEKYRNRVNNNSEIEFRTSAADSSFTGRIYAFEPKVDLETRSVLVRALSPNRSNKIFPGAFARVTISLQKIDNALMVPTQSLIPDVRGESVFMVSDGKAKKVRVETGLRNDTSVLVVSGIANGDTIITTGMMQLRPDMPVQVNILNY